MKNIAIALLMAMGFVACQQKPANENSQATMDLVKKSTIDSMKMQQQMQAVKQAAIDSMKRESVKAEKAVATFPKASAKTSPTSPQKVVGATNRTVEKSTESVATNSKVVAKKKKKSVVKGAVIGAGVGAVAGAIINHNNRGAGALIGGVIGAGAGAATGAIIDKKNK
jgi:cobalamin biosynthesis Mg chelatase CobN